MTYKARQAESVFTKLNVRSTNCSHHVKGFIFSDDGSRLWPPIYYNKGHKEMPEKISDKLRKSLRLDKDEFHEIMICRMSRSKYLSVRKRKGLLD